MTQFDSSGPQSDSDGRLRTIVGAIIGLLILLIIVLVGFDFQQRRAQTLDAAAERAQNLAHILSQHLDRTFSAVDATLAHIALQSGRLGGPVGNDAEWRVILGTARTSFMTLGSISVLDTNGVIRHSTIPEIVGQSRADQFLVRALRDGRANITIADAPLATLRNPSTFVIPLGRRLEDEQGGFAGLVVATLVPDRLRAFYKSVNVGADGAIRILHPSGVTIFHEPSGTDAMGTVAADDPVLAAIRAGFSSGKLRASGRNGAGPQITAYEASSTAGLVIAVSFGEREALAQWRHDAAIGASVAAVLVLALLAVVMFLRRALVERRRAEAQLVRAQKMEAVGQLTGGIAHDFNNLLTVIVGCSDDLADTLPKNAPEQRVVSMITAAGEKAASLTRQLLAFSRQQVLQPVTIEVNQLVGGMSDLLRRTLGEDIEIEFVLHRDASPVLADPTQLESSILNLAINARDAMRNGGKLTIETMDVMLDAEYAARESEVKPGAYVMLAVSDTGTGMSADVLARAFDPFFTTKPPGRGTGLGLSMVFGFVKQSGGHVKIYSEVGHGTTIKVYLPRRAAGSAVAAPAPASEGTRRGTEAILAVEDDPLVRDLVMRQLTSLGYSVVLANDGPAAMAELAKPQRIDLLFTDVVLPGGMSGRELATRARTLRPRLCVLYTSGYTANSIVHHGRLDADVRLLQKPYTRPDLAKAVRAALDDNLSGA